MTGKAADGALSEGALSETEEKAFRTKVTESLWAYEEIDSKLRDRVRDFLIDGTDATCLLELDAAFQNKERKRFFRQHNGGIRAKDRVERQTLFGLFGVAKAPPGYYRRLGEFGRRIPEVATLSSTGSDLIEDWLAGVVKLCFLLSSDSPNSFSFLSGSANNSLRIEPLINEMDDPHVESLIALALHASEQTYHHIAHALAKANDWPKVLRRHPRHVSAGLLSATAHAREFGLQWLVSLQFDFSEIVPAICGLAISSSKRVRPIALSVLRDHADAAASELEKRLVGGKSSERGFAAESLAAIAGADAEAPLRAALENEKAKRVRETLESLLETVASEEGGNDDASESVIAYEFPAIEMPAGEVPLPDGFGDQLWEQLNAVFEQLEQQYQHELENYNKPDRPAWMRKPHKPERADKKSFAKVLEFVSGKLQKRPKLLQHTYHWFHQMPNWSTWTDLTQLHLVHVVRFMEMFNMINQHHERELYLSREDWLDAHRNAQQQPYDLRKLDAAFAAGSRFSPGVIAHSYLRMNNSWRTFLDWEPDAVWPLFAENLGLLRDAVLGVSLHRNDYYVGDRRRTAMKVAGMMPSLPPEIENSMWSVALGEAKSDRPLARRALAGSKNRLARPLKALGDGKQAIRIAAAETLSELGDESAIDPLKKALKKEKQEIVKGAMLQAIEHLGGDVDEFLGRRKQLLDAKKGLQKKRPKGMEWVELDSLPPVRWAEDDKPVAKEILQWWVIQSIQFKLPTCGAILRRSLAMCRAEDAAAYARHLLSQWMAYDTQIRPMEEIVAEATKQARQLFGGSQAKFYKEYYKSEEHFRNQMIAEMQNNFTKSAIGQKGLLAIVSAAGDHECVKMIERFIRKYHGHRLAQNKALLETLGWIGDPSAVQLLLSLGNRFRTKGIRKRAAELVQELADRQGWTMDQLADRTIPDAGFTRETDDEGNPIGRRAELKLDFGSRIFTVILGDDLQPVITRDDGKQVKSLPSAAKDDDPELVKAAKKEFSSAKKTVKEVVKNLAERFYEATCVQRSWPVDQWQSYLADHPIAGALCRRVVWVAKGIDEAETPRLFRPLEDGTLTDVHDDELTLRDDDQIFVAHSSLLDDETEEAWKQHLVDYEVPGLFRQFGRETYRLPEDLRSETDIADFRGHMLTTFRLRSRASKLGWTRGDAEDGGAFTCYHKPFRSQGLTAMLDFSGSYLPEEDIPAALREFYFVPIRPQQRYRFVMGGPKNETRKSAARFDQRMLQRRPRNCRRRIGVRSRMEEERTLVKFRRRMSRRGCE